MYIISEETVLRANQRMMECKVERDDVEFVSQNVCISVFANGRFYNQEVTDREIRKAFKKALISTDVVPHTLVQTQKSRARLILGKRGQLTSKSIKPTAHAQRI